MKQDCFLAFASVPSLNDGLFRITVIDDWIDQTLQSFGISKNEVCSLLPLKMFGKQSFTHVESKY